MEAPIGSGAGRRSHIGYKRGGNNAPASPFRAAAATCSAGRGGRGGGAEEAATPGPAAPRLWAPHAAMERDAYQHYFYDHDAGEDFHRSTAPSEDIWKKFELVPTPPLSPLGERPGCSAAEERGCPPRCCLPDEPEYLIGTGQLFGNLSAFILRDCMWSGFSARERLEKAMTEKLSTGTPRAAPHKPSFGPDLGFGSSVSDCVDPAAVFLCPLAESKVPPSSGSEGQSDSGKGASGAGAPSAEQSLLGGPAPTKGTRRCLLGTALSPVRMGWGTLVPSSQAFQHCCWLGTSSAASHPRDKRRSISGGGPEQAEHHRRQRTQRCGGYAHPSGQLPSARADPRRAQLLPGSRVFGASQSPAPHQFPFPGSRPPGSADAGP